MHKAIIFFGLMIVQPVFAHEGHDEPKVMPAPNRGITRGNENYFFEYVYAKDGGTLFLLDHDGKPAKTAGIDAQAVFEIPRKPKVAAVLVAQETSWKIKAELPIAHRLTLKFTIKDKVHGDTIVFNIEPKK